MNILLFGASGYLGRFILSELVKQSYKTRIIVRKSIELSEQEFSIVDSIIGNVTDPSSITDCCENIDVVISTVGITKQRDGLSYMDVDYQANINVLNEAKKSGVKKFIYISALNGEKLRDLKIFEAKEKFVDELKNSGLEYCIIRPNGFFSDISEFFKMAQKGRVYLFGNGEFKSNPIHGKDLAKFCIDAISNNNNALNIGGPQTFTQKEIANIAFRILGKKPKITHIPIWVAKAIKFLIKKLTSVKIYGPIEFFLTVLTMEMISPEYGKQTLEDFFNELNSK